VASWVSLGPVQAQEKPLAIRAGRIFTVSGAVIPNGVLLIQDGKIQGLGPDVEVPFGTETLDVSDRTVIPGLIDAHSSLYVLPGELEAGPSIAPDLTILDGLDPFSQEVQQVVAQGVTTVCLLPGPRGLIGGRGAVLKLRGAREINGLLVRREAALKISLGVSPGNRSASLERLGDYYALREAFYNAQRYRRELEWYEEDLTEYNRKKKEQAPPKEGEPAPPRLEKPPRPRRDPAQEVLAQALRGDLPVRIEAHRADDLLNAMRLVEEFHLKVVLEGCTEGYRLASEIARREMPVVCRAIPPAGPPRLEFRGFSPDNPAQLAAAGVRVALATLDESGLASRFLRLQAAAAVGHGLDRETALRAITLTPAELLGLGDRLGSLEKGKDADLVILQGDPLDPLAAVERVMIEGQFVYQRE